MALSAASRAAHTSRIRTGRCIRREYLDKNGVRRKCSKAETREVQNPIGRFVCSECDGRLMAIGGPPPYSKAAIGALVALLLVGGGYFGYRHLANARRAASQPALTCAVKERLADQVARLKPEQITALASACFAQNDFNNALPLYFTAAGRGDATAMLAIARMYDPVTFTANKPFRSPNSRQAAEWYARAAEIGAGDDAARGKLKEWLEAKARGGDAEARQTLDDFWK